MKRKELGFLLLRLSVAIGLLALIFLRIDRTALKEALLQIHPFLYGLAVLSFTGVIVLSALRWYVFLQVYPERFSLRSLIEAYFVGLFAANYLPSGGIDLARGLYLVPQADTRAPIFASILIDRLFGFMAILLIVVIGLPFGIESSRPFAPYLWALAVVIPLFLFITLQPKVYSFWIRKLEHLPLGYYLKRLYEAYFQYSKFPHILFWGFFLSLAIQIQFVITAWITGWSIGVRLPFLESVFFVSIVNLLAMIPITISGLGIREGGFVALFQGLMTPEQSVAVSLLYFGTSLINSLVGLGILVRLKGFRSS